MLPTGKNIHALDPQSIPTTAAVASASVVVERLLKRQKQDNGESFDPVSQEAPSAAAAARIPALLISGLLTVWITTRM